MGDQWEEIEMAARAHLMTRAVLAQWDEAADGVLTRGPGRTTADNRAFVRFLHRRGLLCSGDSGGPLLDGTTLPTF